MFIQDYSINYDSVLLESKPEDNKSFKKIKYLLTTVVKLAVNKKIKI